MYIDDDLLLNISIKEIKNEYSHLSIPTVCAFDLDHTVHNLIEFYESLVNKTREHMGYKLWSDEEFRDFHQDGFISNEMSFKRMFSNKSQKALDYYYNLFHTSRAPEGRIHLGATYMLYRLKHVYKIPVIGVTNLEQHMAKKALRDIGLYDLFSSVTGPKGNRKLKPEKELLLIGLGKIDKTVDRSVWMTGDAETDTLCAKDAGATAIRYYQGDTKPIDHNADAFCNSHYKFERIVGTILGYYDSLNTLI